MIPFPNSDSYKLKISFRANTWFLHDISGYILNHYGWTQKRGVQPNSPPNRYHGSIHSGYTVIGDRGVQSRPEASLKYIKMGYEPMIVTQS
jgi:hypothetical protein